MEHHSPPSAPKAKPDAEEHVQHVNPGGRQEEQEDETPSMETGRPPGRCRPKSKPRRNLEGEGKPKVPEIWQSLKYKAHPRTFLAPGVRSRREVGGPLRHWACAGHSQQSGRFLQEAQDEVPRIRTQGNQEAPAATKTARSRKTQSRGASACLRRGKRGPTRAVGVDRERGKMNAYAPTGTPE